MIEIEQRPEKVLIFGVQTENYSDEKFQVLMKEMKSLTETAGGIPTVEMTQKLPRLNSHSAVGSGKLSEIKDAVNKEEIDLVISMNALTPSTNRYIEDQLGVRVIDRIQLILDIFAMRAKSREGKLQVELAQYDYLLPRLQGRRDYLSRLGGGIGTRGPGETKLETDRRHIRTMMSQIKKELAKLSDHRELTRSRRRSGSEFNIGLVGYTNAGKSTILRELTESDTYVEDQLFATLDPLTRKLTINGHDGFTLTDTVGFIEELPTTLIQAFKSTLEEMRYVDLLLHVVDASSADRMMHEQTVYNLIKELEMDHLPILTVYNKKDKIEGNFEPTLFPYVTISALEKDGIEALKQKIWEEIVRTSEKFEVEVDPQEADLLALYRQKTLIESLEFDEENQVYILKGFRRSDKELDKER
uniref:GTPase HflX n=1 Tax=Globicatella sulfidifaciens TaxID=136093 RepID=UPI0023F51687|nr:GTPase HflX [Globicatella sulfidifaciens]